MPPITQPPGPEVRRDFKLHSTGVAKAITRSIPDGKGGEKEAMFVQGIASSNVRDRHGDTISSGAQAQMLESARGITMWLNHSYQIPEDVLGTCEESELKAGTDKDGNDCLDLIIRCKVDDENPRAVKAWKHIQNGTQLAFSIGGNITDCEIDEANDDGESWCPPLIINGLDLLEISLVGIPANPRAYTRSFVQEMSRGFMRNAARDPEVRKHLRNALPALRANAQVDDEPEPKVEPPLFDGTGNVDDTDAVNDLDAALADGATAPVVVPPASDGDVDDSAIDKAGDQDEPAIVVQPPAEPEPKKTAAQKTAVTLALAARSLGEGALLEELRRSVKRLDPKPGQIWAVDPDLGLNESQLELLRSELSAAAGGEIKLFALSPKTASTLDRELGDAIVDLQHQTDELTKTLAQKALELTNADAALAKANNEIADATTALAAINETKAQLEKTIEDLKATPTGRHTKSNPGGSSNGGYVIQNKPHHQAVKELGAALLGVDVQPDPAMRPA
jgi:HK97 family phage prohead protease